MVNDLDAWHTRTTEEIIEPELEICDPHHHFWDRSEIRPGGRYLLDELLSDTNSGHRITETVFIECSSMYRKDGPTAMSPVGETEFVNGLAAMSASGQYGDTKVAAGIVGFADLSLGSAVEEVLVAHKQASPDRFRGIRHAAVWDDDPDIRRYKNPPKGLLYERNFREGFAVLEELDLSFEAWTYHHQLREVADLAKSFPGVRIILNHIAGPIGIGRYADRSDEVFDLWSSGIAELSECPNVVVKLGGCGMPLGGRDWHERAVPPGSKEVADLMAPWYLHCIEKFGTKRCMFESNFPVDKVSVSYPVLWNAFKRIAVGFTDEEKSDLFRATALSAYRIE